MRIVCPNCSAAYEVPDGLLTGRKAVSCARCGQEWRPGETEAVPETEQQVVTREAPVPRPAPVRTPVLDRRGMDGGDWAIDRLMAAPQPPAGPSLALRFAWVASFVVIVALLGAGYAWREDLMVAWPPSVRLFAALGLR
jgi:predicted Zn finger-like uncharacterized protein